jgi:hypothetical protein
LRRRKRGGEKSKEGVNVFHIFSVHVISLLLAFLSVVAVYVYIYFVSDFSFWFMFSAYVMLASDRGK